MIPVNQHMSKVDDLLVLADLGGQIGSTRFELDQRLSDDLEFTLDGGSEAAIGLVIRHRLAGGEFQEKPTGIQHIMQVHPRIARHRLPLCCG